MIRRCDQCEFWVVGEQWGGEQPSDFNEDPDYRLGACHRQPPSPTLGDFEYEVLKHLTTISWHHADTQQQKTDFKDWEEAAYTENCIWPCTYSKDWCGEFKQREST